MKKMYPVLIAAVMAIGFSSFTTISQSSFGPPYKYYNGTNLVNVPSGINVPSLCPADDEIQCIIEINSVDRLIYNSDGTPYMTRQN